MSGRAFTDDDYSIFLLDYGVQLEWEDDEAFYTETYPWHQVNMVQDLEEK